MTERDCGVEEGGKERANSTATTNGMCDTRVLLLHDAAALSPVIRELFCQSVRSLSVRAFADEPTSRAVRTFALATYPRSSSDVFSLVLPREEAMRTNTPVQRRLRPRRLRVCGCALAASLRVRETARGTSG